MIACRPNEIPDYGNAAFGADHPRPMKFKPQHTNYQHALKRPKTPALPVGLISMLVQRNQLDQSLPAMRTPFDNRHALSKLGGIRGFYGSTTQNGRPIRAQKGLGKDNLPSQKPLINSNF